MVRRTPRRAASQAMSRPPSGGDEPAPSTAGTAAAQIAPPGKTPADPSRAAPTATATARLRAISSPAAAVSGPIPAPVWRSSATLAAAKVTPPGTYRPGRARAVAAATSPHGCVRAGSSIRRPTAQNQALNPMSPKPAASEAAM